MTVGAQSGAFEAQYSAAAQRAVLGSVMQDNRLLRGPLEALSIEDFYGSQDQKIFGVISRLSEEGCPFDEVLVAEELVRDDGHQGWFAIVGEKVDGVVPDPGIAGRHAENIRRYAAERRVAAYIDNLQRSQERGADPAELIARMARFVQNEQSGHQNGNLRPELIRLSTVQSKAVPWLWQPYLPFGMLSILSGDPGAGKSFVAMAIAASLTHGRTPRTFDPVMPIDVLYLSVENSAEYVLRPRFDALGGDPEKFVLLNGSLSGSGDKARRAGISLADIDLLEQSLLETKARFVVIDPIQSYLGADTDMHRANETRPILDNLARLADRHSCAVLIVRHLAKAQAGRAIHRGLGSIDFSGAVRSELLAGTAPEGQRVLAQIKSNVGIFGKSLEFEITNKGEFLWKGESEMQAADILAPDDVGREDRSATKEAIEFLQQELAGGPRPSKEVRQSAESRGLSWKTIQRAMGKAGVQSVKGAFAGGWFLELKGAE